MSKARAWLQKRNADNKKKKTAAIGKKNLFLFMPILYTFYREIQYALPDSLIPVIFNLIYASKDVKYVYASDKD